MTLSERMKLELCVRLAAGGGTAEITMKESGDTVIIQCGDDLTDKYSIYVVKSFKLQTLTVFGIEALVETISNYDKVVAERQEKMAELYAMKRDKIDTNTATDFEKAQYKSDFMQIFGYNPFEAA